MRRTSRRRRPWRLLAGLAAVAAAALVALGAYSVRRSHQAFGPSAPPELESWAAVADGLHNSNSDLIEWRGSFWLVHAAAPWHFGSRRTRLIVHRSPDARTWTRMASVLVPGEDVRDPKLSVQGDRLYLYFLPNRHFPEPRPYTTLVLSSADGQAWEPPAEVDPPGWLLWRPKSIDGHTYYVTAYRQEHGRAALFKSEDGRRWQLVSDIVRGSSADETDFEFMEDGRILATSRLEGQRHDPWFGDPDGATLVSVAAPPYATWNRWRTGRARLDGPCLFRWRGRIYAVARYEPGPRGWLFQVGSILARKRTALYLVEPERLVPLALLPSSGDTSYAGVAAHGHDLYVSYYTNRIDRDYPWIIGMLRTSDIRMARLPLTILERLAASAASAGSS